MGSCLLPEFRRANEIGCFLMYFDVFCVDCLDWERDGGCMRWSILSYYYHISHHTISVIYYILSSLLLLLLLLFLLYSSDDSID